MRIRREWTPEEADEWTKEDWLAMLFSVLAYLFLIVGVGLCFLMIPSGLIYLGLGLVSLFLMYWTIDPKLRTISTEYESRQKEYLAQLDRILRWEESEWKRVGR